MIEPTLEEPNWGAYDGVKESVGIAGQSATTQTTDPQSATNGSPDRQTTNESPDRQNTTDGPSLVSPTGTAPPADAVSAGTQATTLTRLTNRDRIDTAPDIAQQGDTQLAVWESYRSNATAADGSDIALATRASGASWDDPQFLTANDGISMHDPAVAATDSRALAAYVRIDTDVVDDLDNFPNYTDLTVRIDDGSGFGDPVQLATGTDGTRSQPSVAPLSNTEWVVAWETWSGSGSATVRYAVVTDSGSIERQEEITDAETPALAATTDGVALVTHDPGAGTLRRDLVTASGRETRYEYAVESVSTVTASTNATAWLTGTDTPGQAVLQYANTGATPEPVPIPDENAPVRAPELLETDRGAALVYRDSGSQQQLRRVAVQTRRNGAWLPPQGVAVVDGSVLTAAAPAATTAVDAEGLAVALTAKLADQDGVGDIVAAVQPFRALYGISGQPTQQDVSPGTDVGVSYTLENIGGQTGTETVRIEARSQGETLATAEESPLAPGETSSGEMTVTLDETGSVTLVAGTNLPNHAPSAGTTEVTVSTPELAVPAGKEAIDFERPDDATATVTVPVRNDGAVAATSVNLRVDSGATVLGEATVTDVPAGGSQSVSIEIDPQEISVDGSEMVMLDPTRTLPASHIGRRATPVTIEQPSVVIDERVRYVDRWDRVDAEVVVTNAGAVQARGRVLAVQADATAESGGYPETAILGSVPIDVPAATTTDKKGQTVTVPLSGAGESDAVRFMFEPTRVVETAGIPIIEDTVEPLFGGSGTAQYYASTEEVIETEGLRQAIDDWRGGDIDTELLREVIDAWRSGEPVK